MLLTYLGSLGAFIGTAICTHLYMPKCQSDGCRYQMHEMKSHHTKTPPHHVLCVSHNRTSSAGAAASVGSAVAVAGVLATMAVRRGPLGTNLGGRGIRMCQVLSGLQWGSPRIDRANISKNVTEYFKK